MVRIFWTWAYPPFFLYFSSINNIRFPSPALQNTLRINQRVFLKTKREQIFDIFVLFSSHTISHRNILYYFLLSVAYCFCYFGSSACSGRISFSEFAYFSAGFASVTIIASPMSANLTVLISPNFS